MKKQKFKIKLRRSMDRSDFRKRPHRASAGPGILLHDQGHIDFNKIVRAIPDPAKRQAYIDALIEKLGESKNVF